MNLPAMNPIAAAMPPIITTSSALLNGFVFVILDFASPVNISTKIENNIEIITAMDEFLIKK